MSLRRGVLLALLAAGAPVAPSPEPPLRTVARAEVHPRSSSDLAAAIASTVPAAVGFQLDGGPRVDGEWLRLAGWLQNTSAQPQEITVFPMGADGFFLQPQAGTARLHPVPGPPLPPPVPPPPLLMTLPPQSRLRVETALHLPDWDWPAGARRAFEWSYLFWNEPRPKGTFILPP